jgi:hypothetical protein
MKSSSSYRWLTKECIHVICATEAPSTITRWGLVPASLLDTLNRCSRLCRLHSAA